MAEIIGILLQVIIPIAAPAGIFFAGYQIYRNSQEQKESNRVRELQLLENAFNQITIMEQYFYEQEAKGPANSILHEEWFVLFFNRVEWLAFLINHKFIRHEELVTYFKYPIIKWYEGVFTKHAPSAVVNSDKAFPSFKDLYKRFKAEQEQ
ncbi:MAG TPA: hypothetical protein VI037_05505 [Nitrososphaera sp.]